jgi:hypothetical protein
MMWFVVAVIVIILAIAGCVIRLYATRSNVMKKISLLEKASVLYGWYDPKTATIYGSSIYTDKDGQDVEITLVSSDPHVFQQRDWRSRGVKFRGEVKTFVKRGKRTSNSLRFQVPDYNFVEFENIALVAYLFDRFVEDWYGHNADNYDEPVFDEDYFSERGLAEHAETQSEIIHGLRGELASPEPGPNHIVSVMDHEIESIAREDVVSQSESESKIEAVRTPSTYADASVEDDVGNSISGLSVSDSGYSEERGCSGD